MGACLFREALILRRLSRGLEAALEEEIDDDKSQNSLNDDVAVVLFQELLWVESAPGANPLPAISNEVCTLLTLSTDTARQVNQYPSTVHLLTPAAAFSAKLGPPKHASDMPFRRGSLTCYYCASRLRVISRGRKHPILSPHP